MTLADELRALAGRVDAYARILGICEQSRVGAEAEGTANALRALAAKVDGKVVVEPTVWTCRNGDGTWLGYQAFLTESGEAEGDTPHEAVANLQVLLDGGE